MSKMMPSQKKHLSCTGWYHAFTGVEDHDLDDLRVASSVSVIHLLPLSFLTLYQLMHIAY